MAESCVTAFLVAVLKELVSPDCSAGGQRGSSHIVWTRKLTGKPIYRIEGMTAEQAPLRIGCWLGNFLEGTVRLGETVLQWIRKRK